ncbi:hypothetical protein ACOSQ4_029116 [Xanthoceras sorbifolium]
MWLFGSLIQGMFEGDGKPSKNPSRGGDPSPQRKSLTTLEETTMVRAVLEQEQQPSGMSRDRRTTGNEKNKLHEMAADLACEYCVMEGGNIRINSQGRDLITNSIPKVNDIIGKKIATSEEGPMQMVNQTLNEEWAKKETKMETISKDGPRWY